MRWSKFWALVPSIVLANSCAEAVNFLNSSYAAAIPGARAATVTANGAIDFIRPAFCVEKPCIILLPPVPRDSPAVSSNPPIAVEAPPAIIGANVPNLSAVFPNAAGPALKASLIASAPSPCSVAWFLKVFKTLVETLLLPTLNPKNPPKDLSFSPTDSMTFPVPTAPLPNIPLYAWPTSFIINKTFPSVEWKSDNLLPCSTIPDNPLPDCAALRVSAVSLSKVFKPFPEPFPATSNLVISHWFDILLPNSLNTDSPLLIVSTISSIIGTPLANAPNINNAPAAAAFTGPGIPTTISVKSFNPFNPVSNTGKIILPTSIFNSVAAALACCIWLA